MRVLVYLMLLLPLGGQAQNALNNLIHTSEVKSSESQIRDKVEQHINALRNIKANSDLKQLEQIFSQTHRKLLKSYVPYSQFNELIESGKYDCLSATALFSLIFDELGVRYKIIETNYHIFLVVHTSRGEVLLETTDRFNGFMTDASVIAARIKSYQENRLADTGRQNLYAFQSNIYQEVTPEKLTGLLYFNQAIRLYNKHLWVACGEKLDNAIALYETSRTAELAALLVHAVNGSDLNFEEKQKFVLRYHKYLETIKPILAAR